ncbi:hypothetical protein GOBAR_DD23526 [Gossypium barbadense]|nr:hypothetical protein GOBAR_DD23526 [Gossypium barbadense]
MGSQDELFTVNFIKNYIRELDDLGRILPKKCGAMKWWKSPRNACVKVNFNATYRKNEESLCSSILLRDSGGRRPANGAAQQLANEGIKQRTEIFLMNDVPEFAEAMVEVDRRWIEAQNEKPQL